MATRATEVLHAHFFAYRKNPGFFRRKTAPSARLEIVPCEQTNAPSDSSDEAHAHPLDHRLATVDSLRRCNLAPHFPKNGRVPTQPHGRPCPLGPLRLPGPSRLASRSPTATGGALGALDGPRLHDAGQIPRPKPPSRWPKPSSARRNPRPWQNRPPISDHAGTEKPRTFLAHVARTSHRRPETRGFVQAPPHVRSASQNADPTGNASGNPACLRPLGGACPNARHITRVMPAAPFRLQSSGCPHFPTST